MIKRTLIVMTAVGLCAAMAHAGTRADLSGDAVVDFQTTMDMPFVTVGNPGNAADPGSGYGAVDYTYRIGKFEVTAGQYTEFLNAVAAEDTYGLYNTKMDIAVHSHGCNIQRSGSPGAYSYSVTADREDRPVNWVSWGDTARFANWLTNGKPTGLQDWTTTEDGSYFLNGATDDVSLTAVLRRAGARYVVPTEDEWYKATYHKNDPGAPGGNYFAYPTSSDTAPSNELIDPDPGNNANFNDNIAMEFTIGGPYWRTEVGEFENSESPYGAFDMGGNVWEWNETILPVTSRGLRGGSYFYYDNFAARQSYHPTYDYYYIGFRIADTVPEPTTLGLLALGGMAALRKKRE